MYTPLKLTSERVATITRAFENMPNTYGMLSAAGIFSVENVPTHDVVFREDNGTLVLLEGQQTEGGDEYKMHDSPSKYHHRRMVSHRLGDVVQASDIQGFAAYGTEFAAKTEGEIFNKKLQSIGKSHDMTEEFLLARTLQGKVMSPKGQVFSDVYQEMGLKRANYTLNWDLGNAATILNDKLNDLRRKMEDNLHGETMTGISVYCNRSFMDALLQNPDFKDIMKQSQNAMMLMSNYTEGQGLTLPGHSNVRFVEYYAVGPDIDGNSVQFMPDSGTPYAFAVPTGTTNTFTMYRGPANRLSTVNRPPAGNGRYILVTRDPQDRYVEITTENVFIPVVKRPKLLWQIEG